MISEENVRRSSKGLDPLSYPEIAELANRRAGQKAISADTVRNLHLGRGTNGRPPNPTVNTLDILGGAFGILDGVRYFTGEDTSADDIGRQVRAVHKIADLAGGNPELVGLMARASQLNPDSFAIVAGLIDRLGAIEANHVAPTTAPANPAPPQGPTH
ncbi:hypothetical protein [Kitasatospora griseola]|uniref:hypothetical protein n=1 Tax=Kitasatospora griseola TaxID=2064 RepID=UPI00343067FA